MKLGPLLHRLMIACGADRWLLPWTEGAAPGSWPARLAPGNRLYPVPTVRQRTRGGILFELDLSDYMEWRAYTGLATEPVSELLAVVSEGDTALEIGTNIGETLLQVSSKVGAKGRAIGFEPHPLCFAKCARNLELNPWANAKAFPWGIGAGPGELVLRSSSKWSRGGARLRAGEAGEVTVTRIPILTLDQAIEQEQIGVVQFIHIDVQGMELEVLKGAARTLARDRPKVFVEICDENLRETGGTARALVEYLIGHGYRLTNARTGARVLGDSLELEGCFFHAVALPAPQAS